MKGFIHSMAEVEYTIRYKTVLIIAHRMRTVESADQIVVLLNGTVAEQSTSEDLYVKNGIYSRMVNLQTESENPGRAFGSARIFRLLS